MCLFIKTLAADFEQMQPSAAGLVSLSQYFDGTRDSREAAAPIKFGQMF